MKLAERFSTEEAAVNGKAPETELVVYAKIGKLDGLTQADEVCHHLQLEALLASGCKCRVRQTTTKDDQKTYIFTVKSKQNVDSVAQTSHEHNATVDLNFLSCFTSMADSKIDKDRYVFLSQHVSLPVDGNDQVKSIELPEVKYEVDRYKKPDGEYSEWCKIDVEVDHILTFIEQNYPDIKDIKVNLKVSHLPFEPTDCILSTTEDPAQRAIITRLWDEEFKVKLKQV